MSLQRSKGVKALLLKALRWGRAGGAVSPSQNTTHSLPSRMLSGMAGPQSLRKILWPFHSWCFKRPDQGGAVV